MVDVQRLLDDELSAVKAAMANAEHDAGDVDDDPLTEDHEDAYWAYRTYHGLRKLLAIAEAYASAPVVTLSRADVGAWNLPDSASGQTVRLVRVVGE